MNAKMLMASSALAMAVAGLVASFLPHELLAALRIPSAGVLPTCVQLHGAALLGFAALNWMAKDSLIGGIYNRPVAIGNLLHFAVGAITLVKWVLAGASSAATLVATALYAIFALGFVALVFGSPVKPIPPAM